jgi:cytochrome c oxidase subunit II
VRRIAGLGVAALACAGAGVGEESPHQPPLSYLSSAGDRADPVVALTWGLIAISVAVVVVMAAAVLGGVGRRVRDAAVPGDVAVERGGNGLRWIWIGVGISCVPLAVILVWTVQVLGAMGHASAASSASGGASPGEVTIEVTANQWWWKLRYVGANPTRNFITANEMHIPVGQRVRLRLRSTDVIHSFWVPALAGKTDVIPGQENAMWLEARAPGRYRGNCGEFCGLQHAHMGIVVVAEPAEAFRLWQDRQVEPAAPPANEAVAQGEAAFVYRCGACHTVRGTAAGGTVAPDLTHLKSRGTLAAATLPHTIATLSAWVANPQAIKPGTRMPNMLVTGPELQSLRNFLETLR